MSKYVRDPGDALNSYVDTVERSRARDIPDALTSEQDTSPERAALYRANDEWIGKYKWDEKKIRVALDKKRTKNLSEFQKTQGKVFHMGQLVDKNSEYIERFEATKKLKETLKKYSGDKGFAEERVLQMKIDAEALGQDFTGVAKYHADKMNGKFIDPAIEVKPKESTPIKQKSFISRLFSRIIFGEGVAPMSVAEMQERNK